MSDANVPVETRFLTYRQAEQFTSYSRWTIHRAVKDGLLKAHGSGRSIRFDKEELVRWMLSGSVVR